METHHNKLKIIVLKTLLSVFLIVSGNLFWYVLIQSLDGNHILTNSTINVIFSLLVPILIFGVYLSCTVVFSVFIKGKLLWVLMLLLSMFDYFLLLGGTSLDLLGELSIVAGLFMFLINFHKYDVLVNGKPSMTNRISSAFSTSALIISFVLAINFYSVYRQTLSNGGLLISNKVLGRMLSPIVSIYNDDLRIINPNEKFITYQKRISIEDKVSMTQVKQTVLKKLRLNSAKDTFLMKDLLKMSLDNSVLKLARDYGHAIPILVSLGLGIVVQTLITISSSLSNYITLVVFMFLRKFNITKKITISYSIERDVWND